jgi:hypothetical protein
MKTLAKKTAHRWFYVVRLDGDNVKVIARRRDAAKAIAIIEKTAYVRLQILYLVYCDYTNELFYLYHDQKIIASRWATPAEKEMLLIAIEDAEREKREKKEKEINFIFSRSSIKELERSIKE